MPFGSGETVRPIGYSGLSALLFSGGTCAHATPATKTKHITVGAVRINFSCIVTTPGDNPVTRQWFRRGTFVAPGKPSQLGGLAFGVKRTWRLHQRGMSSFGPKHEPTAIFRAHGRAVMPSQRCKVIIGLRTRGLIARCILVSLLTMGTRFTLSVFKRHRAQSHFNSG